MQFCNDCGAVLNLLEFPDEEICYSCRKKKEPEKPAVISQPQQPAQPPPFDITSLRDAVLSHEDNQLVLRSPEGWLLWSCPDSSSSTMDKIVNRAERILKIRQKRVKN